MCHVHQLQVNSAVQKSNAHISSYTVVYPFTLSTIEQKRIHLKTAVNYMYDPFTGTNPQILCLSTQSDNIVIVYLFVCE